ncbi:signal peptidase I [Carnobacterium funditum]|uniref:signal peptidase I n=1 Tax=Carnobacterium funditum TaxID=2752 RepID=UPI000554B378|nr:signal peptidase I [Carnobacterium funditum]
MSKTTYSDGRDSQTESFEPRKARYTNGGEYSKNNKKKSFASEAGNTLLYVIIAIIIFFLIRQFLFVPVSVDGDSMYPTLHDNDRLILNKVEKTNRFDIIVFPAPDNPDEPTISDKQYIKRVIGVPGDEIMVVDETLYVNGEVVKEPYLESVKTKLVPGETLTDDFTLASVTGIEKVPDDSYFVMGDNRTNSLDSRIFGFIDETTVSGTIDVRIWPLNSFGMLNN